MKHKILYLFCIAGLIVLSACGNGPDGGGRIEEKAGESVAEDGLITENNSKDNIGILEENLEPLAMYATNLRLWETEDGRACCYAWSDIDGNGQPELFIAGQRGEGNGYEIHIFMIEEGGNGICDVSASDGGGIQVDSLPANDICRDYRTRVLYYPDISTYFYYDGSTMVQRSRFGRDEDSIFYDSDGNEITFARWRNLKTAFAQGKLLSAEKPIWKNLDVQSGHLSDEELLEELNTSYSEYLFSMGNRDVEKVIDRLRLSHEQDEKDDGILLREFTTKAEKGESAQIIFLRYTTENIPVPIYIDYNGEDFYGIWDESKDLYAESECPYQGFCYEFLKVFSETGEDGIIHETVVLTNEEDLSWEDLTGTGDKAEEYPDYLILYGDLEMKDALCLATDNVRIETGNFIKRNGMYLIEDGTQLELLSEMVVKEDEIEPGVDAATGIYRLCSDVEVRDYLNLGSRRAPFRGGLYGDGHVIAGDFFYVNRSWQEWSYYDYELVQETSVSITIEDAESLEEAERTLILYPAESLAIQVATDALGMQAVKELIKQCWEVNHERNHYSVSITDVTEQTEKSDALLPFLDFFGKEGVALMEQAAKEEDSYVSFIRLERVDGLDICTFAVNASEKEQYHLMFVGEWEETEVPFQYLLIPATDTYKYGVLFGRYNISQVDINYDGKEDLLIHEGVSSGSGGTCGDYRAVVWEEDKKEFVWYPSFPEMLVFLEFNERRMIDRYRSGLSYEAVCEYSMADGEYVKTRELVWEHEIIASTLFYYEMGVLVEQHDVTEMDRDEVMSIYPDLDYWMRG